MRVLLLAIKGLPRQTNCIQSGESKGRSMWELRTPAWQRNKLPHAKQYLLPIYRTEWDLGPVTSCRRKWSHYSLGRSSSHLLLQGRLPVKAANTLQHVSQPALQNPLDAGAASLGETHGYFKRQQLLLRNTSQVTKMYYSKNRQRHIWYKESTVFGYRVSDSCEVAYM